MKFDQAVEGDFVKDVDLIGKSTPRIDGPLKTTGYAPYAYERHEVASGQLVGYPVFSGVARGTITGMDFSEAKKAPGYVGHVSTLDMDQLPTSNWNTAPLFGGAKVTHYHQAIAIVVAKTFEQARAAAHLVKVNYSPEDVVYDLSVALENLPADATSEKQRVGDFDAAFAEAEVKLDETYSTPAHSHAMMEAHASIAKWEGEKLTLWTSNQMIQWNVVALATTLDMPAENIRVDSPFLGGGFGAKLFLRADGVLAALAAKKVGKPVKIMLPRPYVANNTTHRPATIQDIKIGARRDGTITAIYHKGKSGNLPGGSPEGCTAQTEKFYAGENRLVLHDLAEVFLPEGNAMRAPGETSGLMALEIAMDEMAEKLGMDPVEFRIKNDIQVDPADPSKKFSQRNFVECLRAGADRFGWADRNKTPGSLRDGQWLIGHGMAGGYRGAPIMDSGARIRLQSNGRLVVETDMTDIGTGSYTIIAQTAAEVMGLPLDMVDVDLGDSNHPVSAGSGGQWGAASSTAGVYAACLKLQKTIAERLDEKVEDVRFEDGKVFFANTHMPLGRLAAGSELVVEDKMEVGEFRQNYIVSTFAGHFVEAAVHVATGEIRVRRMLAACDAGRILNPLSARSQVIGGMTMGVGAAIMEDLIPDTRFGFFANHDLAGYEVPVHMDIPEQDVIFIEGKDPISGPLQAKGVGELGLCGVSAAVANAVYNATGVRIRDYPITLDKYLAELPQI